MSHRPCGVRKSKTNPTAYTKSELVDLAIKKLKYTKSEANSKTVLTLCKDLKIIKLSPKKESKEKEKRKHKSKKPKLTEVEEDDELSPHAERYLLYEDVDLQSRPCSERPMKGVVNRWTRPELERIAMERLQLAAASDLKKFNMETLCGKLKIPFIKAKAKSPKARAKSPKPIIKAKTPQKSLSPKRILKCIQNSKVPLRPYQQQVVEHMQKHDGAIVVHSTGAGKTLTSVTIASCFLEKNPKSQVIVVTPKSLIENFFDNLEKYGGDKKDPRIKVMNYETFIKLYENDEINCKNVLLIVDEAHNLKTKITPKTGKKAKVILECGQKALKRVLLTATPLINSSEDISNLIALAKGVESVNTQSLINNISLERAKEEFGNLFHFYSPSETDIKLYYPERRNIPVYLPMDENYYSKYKAIERLNIFKLTPTFVKKLKNPDEALKFYMGLRMASNSLENEKSIKIKYIIDTIQKNPNSKILIYSFFLDSGIKLIVKELDKLKINYGFVTGEISSAKKRQEIVDDFNSGKKRILFISKAGGEGLDLKGTNAVILLEPTWNESNTNQIIGRAIRYGSHAHLPENKRYVDVIQLYLVKPEEIKYLLEGPMDFGTMEEDIFPSVDNYIRMASLKKQEYLNKILLRLKEISF